LKYLTPFFNCKLTSRVFQATATKLRLEKYLFLKGGREEAKKSVLRFPLAGELPGQGNILEMF